MEKINSKDILEKYTRITNDFDDLFSILKNDSNVISLKKTWLKNTLVLKAVFNVYDGLKPVTFFNDGGFHLISGQSSTWFKSMSKEERVLFLSTKEYVDSYDGSVTIYEPFYKENAEMKCGKDVKFFGRFTQTCNIIINEIIKNKLYEKKFEEWGTTLNIDTLSRKTHKSFTNKDFFYFIESRGTSRGISVISKRSYEGKYKRMFKAVRKMYCAKLSNNTSRFNKHLAIYREEMFSTNLINRINNPQIRRKDSVAYKIFHELGMGNLCTDLTAKTSNKEMFSKRQSLLKKLNIIKNTIFSSDRKELGHLISISFKNIKNMSTEDFNDKLAFFENVINKHSDLKSILKLKKSKYNNISSTSNSVCSFSMEHSKPFLIRNKNGKLIHYSSWEKYQNAMNYLKTNRNPS